MKQKKPTNQKWTIIFTLFLAVIFFNREIAGDYLHTVDRKVYEGKMVAFKYNTIYFNVYKFGKIYGTRRFPLHKIWKIEFNEPMTEGLESSFEIEQNYNKLRKGKRTRKILLEANQKWVDTEIDVVIGQDILFSATGSIYIDKNTMVYQNGESELNWDNKKPLPNQPTGAIIGRVGKKGEMFYIGNDKAPFQMVQKGRLYIGINDIDFSDNSGKFNVTVYY